MWEARLSLDDATPWQVGGSRRFWSDDTETAGAGHWQDPTAWQAEIEPMRSN